MSLRAGLLAEYTRGEELVAAARRLHKLGYRRLDAFTPYPVRGLPEALAVPKSKIGIVTLVCGLFGAGGAYMLQWWFNAYNYPLNVGGRPPHSAPAFVPITFEMGVLFAGLAAFLSVFIFSRLTTLYHPVFEVPGFERATIDRFWLGVDATDTKFDLDRTRAELLDTAPVRVELAGIKA
jgi:hypothetical protein